MLNFLIKLLLLLSSALSLHSALALPLSSVLLNDYYTATDSVELKEQINSCTVLNDFTTKQSVQSKLQTSLLTLLQQEHNDNRVLTLFIAAVNALDIDVSQLNAQAIIQQAYQEQLTTHNHIQAKQNALYNQKTCYQAKLQYQQNLS